MAFMTERRTTHPVFAGKKQIGGNAPVSIQSMTNTDTHDADATEAQIRRLVAAGCDIVRLAVPDREAAKTFYELKNRGITVHPFQL